MINRVSPEAIEQAQAELREKIRGRQEQMPRPANGSAVIDLGDHMIFTWRGSAYRAHVDYKQGIRAAELLAEINSFGDEVPLDRLSGYQDVLAELARLAKQIAKPRVRRWRWIKRLRVRLGLYRNPFRDATEAELGDLTAFFYGLRTKSGLR